MAVPYYKIIVLIVLGLLVVGAEFAHAGFGITPPYVRNTSLTRNVTYEQQILMVRSDAEQDLIAEITVDAPEINDWIEIVEGERIELPAGEQRIPMTVRVQVPEDAEFTDYEGRIRIRTTPSDEDIERGAVSISLGAQVDLDLSVIDREIRDFRVRRVSVNELNEGHSLAWLYFPGRIEFGMRLENTGNIDVAPTKVEFDIYDVRGETLLEETETLGKIETVDPYSTGDITAHIPTRLPAGNYVARYTVYNGDEVKQSGELNLSILPYGTLQKAGFGLLGLSTAHKLSLVLPIVSLLIVIIYALYYWRQRRHTKSRR